MDLSNIDPNFYGIGIAMIVIYKLFDLFKEIIMKRKNGNGNGKENENIEKLIISVKDVMQGIVVTLAKNNLEIDELRKELKNTNQSALQATAIMSESSETVKDKVKEMCDNMRRLEDNIRRVNV